jgi:hypothetical protein
MTQFFSDPRKRLQELPATSEANLAKLRELCKTWDRDPEEFTRRYLGLTARSPFFRDHPDKALVHFAEKYLCANPIDGRTQDAVEVVPDADEIDIQLSMPEALRVAIRKQGAPQRPSMPKTVAPECPSTVVQCVPAKPVVLTPCSYAQLQTTFIGTRGKNKIRNSDMVGMLGYSGSWISGAESNPEPQAPTFFLSRRVITAYANNNAADKEKLERLAVATFYPKGIGSLSDMIKFLAYYDEETLDKWGQKLEISNLSLKLSERHRSNFSLSEKLVLRLHLLQRVPEFAHLGLSPSFLDGVLPDPLKVLQNPDTDFGEMLSEWAKHVAGDDTVDAFAKLVLQKSGAQGEPPKNILYRWRTGNGLTKILPAMIAVLEEDPKTQYLFADCKEAFLQAARIKITKSCADLRR